MTNTLSLKELTKKRKTNTFLIALLALHPCQVFAPLLCTESPSLVRDRLTSLSFALKTHSFSEILLSFEERLECLSANKETIFY